MDAEQDKALWSRLLDIGYLAMSLGMFDRAIGIFQGLAAYRPQSEHPVIGHALTLLRLRKRTEAIDLLRNEALKRNPESDLAKGIYGLALQLSGNKIESEIIFNQVVKANRDPEAVKFARAFLDLPNAAGTTP